MVADIATKQVNELLSISRILILIGLIIHLSGCGGHVYHVVEPGETLYSIGWVYGYDYRQIARWNEIKSPYALRIGQRLRVAPQSDDASSSRYDSRNGSRIKKASHSSGVSAKRRTTSTHGPQVSSHKDDKKTNLNSNSKTNNKTHKKYNVVWRWPLKGGKVSQTFDAKDPARRGVDLIGHDGQAIYSAAAGKVVYSGGGIPRYGKLVIIKHNDEFLSAYAHNKRLYVKEGETLKGGQHIADMGRNNANKIKLHFEIRHNGTPVDPLQFLPAQAM